MSDILQRNNSYAKTLKDVLRLRREPVAIKLIRKGEPFPEGMQVPEKQISHCQAVAGASNGSSFKLPLASQSCMVGASALNMTETPEKVASGEFHYSMGMHDSQEAVARMIAQRMIVPFECDGELVAPLKDADFIPDIVAIIDIPERCYWTVPLATAEKGGRIQFSTSPFQCCCEDIVAVPMCTGSPNISLGCFGCRKRTDMKADEMAVGIPYSAIPDYVDHLRRYESGVMTKAKRDREC